MNEPHSSFAAAPTTDDLRAVSPALARYTEGPLLGDVWKRPDLSARDRSLVTLAALVARNQAGELPPYLELALENGVKPEEISELITHLTPGRPGLGISSIGFGCMNDNYMNQSRALFVFLCGMLAACSPAAPSTTAPSAGPSTVLASTEAMTITRAGSQPSSKGSAATFAGDVTVTPLFSPNERRHSSGGLVAFSPGARSAWHTHAAGQTLIVTAGTGWVQSWGGRRQEIRQGDVVWTAPGVKHWHGATDRDAMTHIAIQDLVDGKAVDWMEPVSAAQARP